MREARPILQALRSNNPINALCNPNNPVNTLLTYPNASNDLFTGRAARTIKQELLNLLETTDDPNIRRGLLFVILHANIEDLSWSRIQFEGEDWEIIARAADRMNQEDGNTVGTGVWNIFEHKGHKILRHPIPAMP